MSRGKDNVLKNLGYLFLIVLLLVVVFVMLGVVYPWMSGGLSNGVERAGVDRQALEHGHSHDDYDHTHEENVVDEFDDFNASFEKAGYEITFSNVRYVFEPNFEADFFKLSMSLKNNDFLPYAKPTLVCDVSEGGRVVVSEGGVKLSSLENVYPGDEHTWEVTVNLQSKDERWVSSCKYTPTGSFEPSKVVEVSFPKRD